MTSDPPTLKLRRADEWRDKRIKGSELVQESRQSGLAEAVGAQHAAPLQRETRV